MYGWGAIMSCRSILGYAVLLVVGLVGFGQGFAQLQISENPNLVNFGFFSDFEFLKLFDGLVLFESLVGFVSDSQQTLGAFGNYFVEQNTKIAVQTFHATFSDLTLLLFAMPIVGQILFRSEIKKIDLALVRRILRGTVFGIILSMIVFSPFSMSGYYWPGIFATSSTNTTSSAEESPPPYTSETSSAEDTTSSTNHPSSTDDGSPPDTGQSDPVEDTTSSYSNTTASVADSLPPYTNGTTTEDTTSLLNNDTSTDYNGTSIVVNGTGTESIPVNGTSEFESVIVPNATESWSFDTSVNGSQFIGQVYETNSTLLVEEGYMASNGTTTSDLKNLSITAWVKPNYDGGSAQYTVVSKERSFALTINNNIEPEKVAQFSIFDGIKWHSVETTSKIGEDWSHLAATFNGTLLSIYTNGTISNTLVTQSTTIVNAKGSLEPAVPSMVNSTSDVVIGASLDNTRSVDDVKSQFHGQIDDLNIYKVYLSAQQIYEIYSRSLPSISKPNFEDLGVEELIASEPVAQFDMQNTTLTAESPMLGNYAELNQDLSRLSISAWVKPNYTNGATEYSVVSKENSFILSINNVLTPQKMAQFAVFDGIRWTSVVGTEPVTEDRWAHLVAMVDGTEISLYQNGGLVDSAMLEKGLTLTDNGLEPVSAEVATSDSEVVIGAYADTTRSFSLTKQFSGKIDDVFVYTRTLSEVEIAELYADVDFSTSVRYVPAVNDVDLAHDSVEVGNSVEWTQKVTLENETDIVAIQIPDDANIHVIDVTLNSDITRIYQSDGVNGIATNSDIQGIEYLQIIPKSQASIQTTVDYQRILVLDGTSIPIAELDLVPDAVQDSNKTKLLVINKTGTEYGVTYETQAPYIIEEEQITESSYNKTVTVAHNSTLHYTNVKSSADIPEDLVAQGVEFSLFWNINGTKTDVTNDPRFQVEFVDTDDNGVADQIQWIVPQLSAQEFEIVANITIINVQSYPVVGGNWTVYFNTTGTADLTITAVNWTTFGDTLPYDLQFLELNNGTHNLNAIISGQSITFHNYSSTEQGFISNKVLTPGEHHLRFTFGNNVKHAHNDAFHIISVAPGSSVPGCETTNECYLPFSKSVQPGTDVTWRNDDTAAHTVTSGTPGGGPDGVFDSGLFLAGETFSQTFSTLGTFDYFCLVHPWMTGQIVVEDSPLTKISMILKSPLDGALLESVSEVVVDVHFDTASTAAILAQIQDGNGVTVFLGWVDPLVPGTNDEATAVISLSSPLSTDGNYDMTIFAWDSVSNPTALAPPIPISFTIDTTPLLSMGDPETVDPFGTPLAVIFTGEQIHIQTQVTNNQGISQPFAYFVEILDEFGVQQTFAWITGSLGTGQTFSPSLAWTTGPPGNYRAIVSFWDDSGQTTLLAGPKPLDFEVRPLNEVRIEPGSAVLGCETTNTCLTPNPITITQGETITWRNDDTAAHTVTSGTPGGGPDGTFDSGLLSSGATFQHTFNTAGTFDYYDVVHPWVTGQVIVNSLPALGLTDVRIEPGTSVPGCETTNTCLTPNPIIITLGNTITWHNDDTAAHTVTSGTPGGGPDGEFDSSLFMPGTTFQHTFNTAGTFDYFDLVHPWITGQVIVLDNNEVSIPPGTSVPGCEVDETCYIPSQITISRGETVTWRNDDTAAHTVTSGTPGGGPDGEFDSSLFMPGTTFQNTFNDVGTFDYFCMVHPWQTGQVTVQNNPPVANDDTITTQVGVSVDIDVLANDSDADLDTLLLDSFDVTGINGGTITRNDQETPGDTSDDTLQFNPAAGFRGVDRFSYTVSDGTDTDVGTVDVAILGTNGKIAFTSSRDGNTEVYAMNRDGTSQTNISNNAANDFFANWSPDGAKIAFTSTRDGNNEVYTMNSDGTGVIRLINDAAGDSQPSRSPDGAKIAFTSSRDGNNQIYTMNQDGTDQTNISRNGANDSQPSWSPDGTQIAFTSNRDGNSEIYVMNQDGTAQIRLTVIGATDNNPSWSPDGTKIAFTSTRDGNAEVYAMNRDGTGQTNISSNGASNSQPSWSPDGTRITFQSLRDGNLEIYVMSANGPGPHTRLTNNVANDFSPDWGTAPDTIPTCEMNLSGDLNYGSQDPLSGPGIEKTVNISNGELLDAVISVYGTNWDDGAGSAEMDVGQTRFSTVSNPGDYANKTPLPLSSSSLTTVNGGTNVNTYWQLEVALNPGSETFIGDVQQTVIFDFTCL